MLLSSKHFKKHISYCDQQFVLHNDLQDQFGDYDENEIKKIDENINMSTEKLKRLQETLKTQETGVIVVVVFLFLCIYHQFNNSFEWYHTPWKIPGIFLVYATREWHDYFKPCNCKYSGQDNVTYTQHTMGRLSAASLFILFNIIKLALQYEIDF